MTATLEKPGIEFEYKNLERKQVNFEIEKFSRDEKYFCFTGLASTFGNVDLGDDVMVKGCFEESLKTRGFKLLWQHQMTSPIGIPITAKETDNGLFLEGRISIRTVLGNDTAILIEDGVLDSMSIGFSIPSGGSEYKSIDGTQIRFINKADLYEVSIVTLPMNPSAMIGAKSLLPENKSELTIGDVIKATARIKGLGVHPEMKEGEKEKTISELNQYYEKNELPNPLEKGFSPLIDSLGHIKGVRALLKCCYSDNESNAIIDAIKRTHLISKEEKKAETKECDISEEIRGLSELFKS